MDYIVRLIGEFGLLAVFLNVLLDEGGLPLPAAPLLAVAGALAAQGQLSVVSVIGAAVSGAFIADNCWYWIARRYGRRVLALLCKLSLSPDSCVRQTETLFVKVGPAVLLFAKFIPGLGGLAIALSGITRIRPAVFMTLEIIGASLYLSVPVLLGWLFHDTVTTILNGLAGGGEIGLAIVVGGLALYIFLRWWQRMLFIRQLRMDRITVDELVNLLDIERKPLILDVRSRQARAGGVIPGAIAAHPEDMHPTLEHHNRDTEIVVYCACPNEATAALAAKHLKKAGFKKIRPLLGGVEAWSKAGHKLVVVEEAL
jgi:membrane protein DedA with SNARE-associated domain/rhodanese-related sulfurtransferase